MTNKFRVGFAGSADFAVPALNFLFENQQLVCLLTQPDKRRGRDKAVSFNVVKQAALRLDSNLPVFQPTKLKDDDEFKAGLLALKMDVLVVAAYGRILPEWLLELPKISCVNLHGSLLPEYRGASPIQYALFDGKRTTGCTLMYMASELDAGDMIYQDPLSINPDDDYGSLTNRLAGLATKQLARYFQALARGDEIQGEKQDSAKATYAPLIEKARQRIDFKKSATDVVGQIRGLSPKPGAYCQYMGERIKILKASVSSLDAKAAVCGEVLSIDSEGITVACESDSITFHTVIPQNKSQMTAAAFARGKKLTKGSVFE